MNADSVLINGGNPLKGQVSIQGAKNAALPILASTILFNREVYLHNVPDLLDIRAMLDILKFLGAQCSFEDGVVYLNCENLENKKIPSSLSDRLRASSLVLGPLLARFGECEIGMPGGCSIGARPLNYHFDGFEALGAEIIVEGDVIKAKAKVGELKGIHELEFPSVGATENLISCAVFSNEKVILKNIAREPEIIDFIQFLVSGGAKIAFTDVSTIEIQGVKELNIAEHGVQPDRIEAGTFLVAGLVTKGSIKLRGAKADHLSFFLHKLNEMGATVNVSREIISVEYSKELVGVNVKTAIYPGFPTDLQPQMSILMTQATTPSMLTENLFENRLKHLEELEKMGAKIKMAGRMAFIKPSSLVGTSVRSYDLRGAASMVIAGLVADGTTRVMDLKHLYRGYEAFIEKLKHLGADICYL